MVKNLFLVIFISVLITGCDNQIIEPELEFEEEVTEENEVSYYLDLESYLDIDENGYYIMEYLQDWNQTFTTLTAMTGSYNQYQRVAWISNKEIWMGNQWINLVNGDSYTDENGEAHSVLGVWEEFIGDTVKVYAGYNDEYNNHYLDSLEVIIKNEE
jgi:hypothetical protein